MLHLSSHDSMNVKIGWLSRRGPNLSHWQGRPERVVTAKSSSTSFLQTKGKK